MGNSKGSPGQKTVLALDEGTTGSTALVVSEDGRILAKSYRGFTQHFPEPGWVEHDADEIWRVTLEAAREALETSGARPDAVGITNQRETVVAWDRKTFDLPKEDDGRRIHIEFDGAFRDSSIWVNGHFAARHLSGYTSFCCDISELCNYGGHNAIAVRH